MTENGPLTIALEESHSKKRVNNGGSWPSVTTYIGVSGESPSTRMSISRNLCQFQGKTLGHGQPCKNPTHKMPNYMWVLHFRWSHPRILCISSYKILMAHKALKSMWMWDFVEAKTGRQWLFFFLKGNLDAKWILKRLLKWLHTNWIS